jgi:tripartite-type tricarboxylate transporter receptor subunit TctC
VFGGFSIFNPPILTLAKKKHNEKVRHERRLLREAPVNSLLNFGSFLAPRTICRLGAVVLATFVASPAFAQSAEEFFASKHDLNLITSGDSGGGYDLYTRLVARHLGKYLPGKPNYIVNNMPGGGGVRASNHLYNVAPKDGSVIGLIDRGMATAPLLYGEQSKTQFDAVKFNWIGSAMRESGMGVISTKAPATTIEGARQHEVFFGATGPETDPAMYARLFNELFGTKIKVISGYPGQPETFQAIEKGELHGLFMSGWSGNGRNYVRDQIKKGNLKLFVQMATKRDPMHDDTPTILELVENPQDKQIVELVLTRLSLGRPFVGPPGIPADRVAWRKAVRSEDPDLLAEAKKTRLALDPMYGEEAQELVKRLYATPPDVIERTRHIVRVK